MTRQTRESKAVRGFVHYNHEFIVMTRSVRVRTTTGGYKDITDHQVDPQELALIEINPLTPPTPMVGDGRDAHYTYTIIGPVDADIKTGDVFAVNGQQHKVDIVFPSDGKSVRALSVAHG